MTKWFYVLNEERQGPVSTNEIQDLFRQEIIGLEDFVWKKGMEDWSRVRDQQEILEPEVKKVSMNLTEVDKNIYYIRAGSDRGVKDKDYGPFSLNILKKLYDQNRINLKTKIFTKEMSSWLSLNDFEELHSFFNIQGQKSEEKRIQERKPFTARIFFSSSRDLLEGICSDLSLGGMKILMDHFPGKEGDIIKVNVHPDNSDFHFMTSGEVVRVLEAQKGFSFQFSGLSEEARKAISRYIQQENR